MRKVGRDLSTKDVSRTKVILFVLTMTLHVG